MSGLLAGAALRRGPKDASKFALVALAENADDFGFAQIRQETLAPLINRNARQVVRYINRLVHLGWVCRVQKAVEGCGNVYFLNLAKLGVQAPEKSRKSPLHREFLSCIGADWAGPRFAQASVQNLISTGDNPQPPQVTKNARQVTPQVETGDKTAHPNIEAPLVPRFSVDTPSKKAAIDDGRGKSSLGASSPTLPQAPMAPRLATPACGPPSARRPRGRYGGHLRAFH